MLDLKKLKEQLNEALEKETKESLTNWLKEKRKVGGDFILGEGELYEMEIECVSSSSLAVRQIEYIFEYTSTYFEYNYSKAA